MRYKLILVCLILVSLMNAGCRAQPASQNKSDSAMPGQTASSETTPTVVSTEMQPIRSEITLSGDEELQWMKFFSMFVRYYPDFSAADLIEDKRLISSTLFYVFDSLNESELKSMEVRHPVYGDGLKREAIDKAVHDLFGRSVRVHQSTTTTTGVKLDYRDGVYYYGGFSNDGTMLTHIKEFINNNDGTYTVQLDAYFISESEILDTQTNIYDPKVFIDKIHSDPAAYKVPGKAVVLVLKKVAEGEKERFIVLEKSTP